MDNDQLLDELTIYESLPETAIREATERRAEMLPLFLQEIETFLADEDPIAEVPTPLFMILHILGSWHEKSAYRPVARLLMADSERLEWALSDAITTTVPRIMLNLFDGDARPLYDIVACETADEFIRAGMLRLLATLARQGKLRKNETASYIRNARFSLQPQSRHFVWVGWQDAVAMLGLADMRASVKAVFDRGFIDPTIMGYDDFEIALSGGMAADSGNRSQVMPFGDTIEELSTWYGFSEAWISGLADDDEATEDLDDLDLLADPAAYGGIVLSEPIVNPFRDVGRNDPCPCGSGKKFKRCCLGKDKEEMH
jgi:uncharacterized protein